MLSIMVEKFVSFPENYDGEHKRPWIVKSEERGESASVRVTEILLGRPWVTGKIIETERSGEDDMMGVDLFVPINEKILGFLGLVQDVRGVPFQVKSGDHSVEKFVRRRKIFNEGEYRFEDGKYIFVLNGQNSMEVILADIVGQMVGLACRFGDVSEAGVLDYIQEELGDKQAVLRYLEHKVILLDSAWYRRLLSE